MKSYDFKEVASYKIVDHLYDVRKDFIILGLCGKVGSGVSTVSEILEKSFDDLQLPKPGFGEDNLYASHEYRILYHYARQNWSSFHKIRTSALITRRILAYSKEDFDGFLSGLYDHAEGGPLKEISRKFFNRPMDCDWQTYCRELGVDSEKIVAPWKLFQKDVSFEKVVDHVPASCADTPPEKLTVGNTGIGFTYDPNRQTCSFTNMEISKLFDHYAELRKQKSEFQNPFWHFALKQYIYEFLPQASAELWKNIQDLSRSLPTLALQYLGNNLRISKTPYFNNRPAKDGYTCLAEDINLAVKVFRAYQLKRKRDLKEEDVKVYPSGPNEIRTTIVIDSIKNPYESMYLKDRYSNYYLMGIYTEDAQRHERLRKNEHLIDDDIAAIDIIEQNSEFKKKIHEYQRRKNEQGRLEDQTPPVPPIIQKMYEQFEKYKLLNDLPYISPFVMQNVSSCLESADILINNKTDNQSYYYLKRTLLRYVSLIMNPALVLPTPIEHCMQIANTAKLNSGCISRQVGAVLTDSRYHFLSMGWNQQPEGQLPCSYRDLCELRHHWSLNVYSDYESDDHDSFQQNIKDQVEEFFDTEQSPLYHNGKLPCYCFKDYFNSIEGKYNQVHTRSLHAEETAFLNLGANHERVNHGILFTTSSPCELCAKKAVYHGVDTIYYVEPYSGVSQKHVLSMGESSARPRLILFTGAIGTAYTKLYTPLLPRKDENEMWIGAKMNSNLISNLPKTQKDEAETGKT